MDVEQFIKIKKVLEKLNNIQDYSDIKMSKEEATTILNYIVLLENEYDRLCTYTEIIDKKYGTSYHEEDYDFHK